MVIPIGILIVAGLILFAGFNDIPVADAIGLLVGQKPSRNLGVLSGLDTSGSSGTSTASPSTGTAGTAAGSSGNVNGLQPVVLSALDCAKKNGWTGTVISGYRSAADQARVCSQTSGPCAAPGTSMHQKGLAVDVSDVAGFQAAMNKCGNPLTSGASFGDPNHFSTTGH